MCQVTKNIELTAGNNHDNKIHIREETYFGEALVLRGLPSDGTKSLS